MPESYKTNLLKKVFIWLGLFGLVYLVIYFFYYFPKDNTAKFTNLINKSQASELVASNFDPSNCSTYINNGGSESGGVCMVKLYNVKGQLYRHIDITKGENVFVEAYYNNSTNSDLTGLYLQDSLPSNVFQIISNPMNSYGLEAATYTNLTPNISGVFTFDIQDNLRGYGKLSYEILSPISAVQVGNTFNPSYSLISNSLTLTDTDNQITLIAGSIQIPTLSKVYWDGLIEKTNLNLSPGEIITVRLKYNNTSDKTINGLKITDNRPFNDITYIENSAKNCYNNLVCTALDNNNFASVINTSASSSRMGYASNASITNLDTGKNRYLKLIHCEKDIYSTIFVASSGNTNQNHIGDCAGQGLNDYTKSHSYVLDILGKKYLNLIQCQKNTYITTFIGSATNQTGAYTGNCEDYNLTGYTKIGGYSVELEGGNYLSQIKCQKDSYIAIFETASTNQNQESWKNCEDFGLDGYTKSTGNSIQILNTLNGYGYIEYKLEVSLTLFSGTYGANASFEADNINTQTSNLNNSLTVSLNCESVIPSSQRINARLGDAELRADQNFICVYTAEICPLLFLDSNSNSSFDVGELQYENYDVGIFLNNVEIGNQIEVKYNGVVQNGVSRITTNNTTNRCFSSLRLGQDYEVRVMTDGANTLPTPYSTTGGNSQFFRATTNLGTKIAEFGYTTGNISLSVPEVVYMSTLTVSKLPTYSTGDLNPVTVINNTDQISPGWSVTAVSGDFVGQLTGYILPVSNNYTLSPGGITIGTGANIQGINPGSTKTITSTSDPVNVFSADPTFGIGMYDTNIGLNLLLNPFVGRVDNYNATIEFQLVT
jgi:hypothetical protein